jgi:hypothetical protein
LYKTIIIYYITKLMVIVILQKILPEKNHTQDKIYIITIIRKRIQYSWNKKVFFGVTCQ